MTLMDASLLLTHVMFDTTAVRRDLVRQDLVYPYTQLVTDKNQVTPDWLVGDDITGEI